MNIGGEVGVVSVTAREVHSVVIVGNEIDVVNGIGVVNVVSVVSR